MILMIHFLVQLQKTCPWQRPIHEQLQEYFPFRQRPSQVDFELPRILTSRIFSGFEHAFPLSAITVQRGYHMVSSR